MRGVHIVAFVLCACSRGQTTGGALFTGPGPGSSATTPGDDPDDGDDDDAGDSGDDGPWTGTTSGPGEDTGPFTAGSAGDTGDAMPGESSGLTGGDESSTGPFMPGNGQPAMGMYASCFEPDLSACTPFAPLCMMVASMMIGVCTHAECTTPADCNAAPLDATANPICFPAQDPTGMDVGLCALDCSTGKTCPAGMECVEDVAFGDDLLLFDICF
jgi:hypothetical protein